MENGKTWVLLFVTLTFYIEGRPLSLHASLVFAHPLPLPSLEEREDSLSMWFFYCSTTPVSNVYCGWNKALTEKASTKKSLILILSLAPCTVFFHLTVRNHFQEVLVLLSRSIMHLMHSG